MSDETYPKFYARGGTVFCDPGPNRMKFPLCEVNEFVEAEEGEKPPAEEIALCMKMGLIVTDFIKAQKIQWAEQISDNNEIIVNAYGLIESLCEVAGYYVEAE